MNRLLAPWLLACGALVCAAPAVGPKSSVEALCTAVEDLFPKLPASNPILESYGGARLDELPAYRNRKGSSYYPSRWDLRFALYFNGSSNPYSELPRQSYIAMVEQNWASTAQKESNLIQPRLRDVLGGYPRFVVEVGSFVGSGAVHTWGPLVRQASPIGFVLCIDPWLGDLNMRISPRYEQFLRMERGFPRVYQTFLDVVVAYGLTDTIFPLSMPSISAARLLAAWDWKVDVVFVDSAHEQGETLVELHLYFQLLRPGGVLLGDDYLQFPAVKHDVDIFSRCRGLPVEFPAPNIWMIVKPM